MERRSSGSVSAARNGPTDSAAADPDGDRGASAAGGDRRRRPRSRDRDDGDTDAHGRRRDRRSVGNREDKSGGGIGDDGGTGGGSGGGGERGKRKGSRSGSRQRDDNGDGRKRRRQSCETKSRSKSRFRENRSTSRENKDRQRDQKLSDMLQLRIDRLKEEIEHEKKELVKYRRDLRTRSRSRERKSSYLRSRRSRSRSLDMKGRLRADHRSRSKSFERNGRSRPLPSVKQFLSSAPDECRDSQKVVKVENVDFGDELDEQELLAKFRRFGTVVDFVFDRNGAKAYFYYNKLMDAEAAVKGMDNRFYRERYLTVQIVDESDINMSVQHKCHYCDGDHPSESCPDKTEARYSRQKRRSRARSRSLELHWPTNPRHPSTQLFDQERSLSPLSTLIASESFRNGGVKPVSFPPKPLRTDLNEISLSRFIGRERLTKRALMMKQASSVISYNSQDKSFNDFEVIATIGKGSYGQMYKAIDKSRETLRALKKMTTDSEKNGLPASALQELRLLGQIDHSNVAKLLEIIADNSQDKNGMKSAAFYFVYDYMNHDLKRLLQSKSLQLKTSDFAWLIKQLFSALSYCHQVGLVHCDIKPSNILINNRGDLKLTQFSFACFYDAKVDSSASSLKTNRRVPLWYRSPELLLGDKMLKPPADIWSCGCVIGEMFSKKPIFLGSDEENQMEVISKVCGSPNTSNWPDVASLPMFSIIKKYGEYPRLFHDAFHYMPYMARNLLDQLLVMDPQKRLTAEKSLELDWLKNTEFPKMLPMMLMQLSDCHLLMSAKLSTESEMRNLTSLSKTSVSSFTGQKLTGSPGKTIYSKFTAEDFSDKVSIKSYSESPYVREPETYQKPLVSGLSRDFHGAPGLAFSGEPKAFEDSKRRAFNPRVIDYDCQPSSLKSDNSDKQTRPGVSSYSRTEIFSRYSDQDDRSRTEHDTSSFESKSLPRRDFNQEPVKGPSPSLTAKATGKDIQDARTYSAAVADLERLRMLSKQLEMIGKEKSLISNTSTLDNNDKRLKMQSTKEESAEATEIRFNNSSDIDCRKPLDFDNRWDPRAAYRGESDSASIAAKKESYPLQVGTEGSFRSRHELEPNDFFPQSPHIGRPGEDNYPRIWDREGSHAGERSVSSSHSTQQLASISGRHSDLYNSPKSISSKNSSFQASNYSASKSPDETFERASRHSYSSQLLPPQPMIFPKGRQDAGLYENEAFPYARNAPNREYTGDFSATYDSQQKHSKPSVLHPEASQMESTVDWRMPQSRF